MKQPTLFPLPPVEPVTPSAALVKCSRATVTSHDEGRALWATNAGSLEWWCTYCNWEGDVDRLDAVIDRSDLGVLAAAVVKQKRAIDAATMTNATGAELEAMYDVLDAATEKLRAAIPLAEVVQLRPAVTP